MLQHAGALYILPCKCASPHSGVPFLKIGTSKSGPRVWCFPHFDLQICFAPQRRAIFEHRNVQNGSGIVVFLCILTCKCASRHSRVAFWNIGTSKIAPPMLCFVHFDLQMCFAPQPRAILQHLNVQNGSGIVVFCAFWLANVLRATAACHFSPVRGTATSAPAALASLLFEHQEPTIHWENTAIRDFTNIFRACTFFLVTLHAGGSSFCWLDISTLLHTSTLLFNSAYCRKLDF